jgi:mRNA-degrading endonuclease RelE of RelBE toxin-antitoxin system
MNFNVIATPRFIRELKRLVKKYPSLKTEYISLIKALESTPSMGVPIGNDCYKIRLSVASKGKGKSGSVRIITYLYTIRESVFLLSIYNKGEQDDIDNKELLKRLKRLDQ